MAKTCKDCGPLPVSHFQKWIEDLIALSPFFRILSYIPAKFQVRMENLLEKIFIWLKLVSSEKNFSKEKISLRSAVFINEARKQGINFTALRGPFGYNNNFQMSLGKKFFSFEGLPRAEFLNTKHAHIIDDKAQVKSYLERGGFPVLKGKSFWWFEKNKALRWAEHLGFPLVVKPRAGSMSQHITTNIRDIKSLKSAILKAISYSPAFLIERFLSGANVYRATVIDFSFAACVERVPAHIIGDGVHTIAELVEIKNSDPRRGNPGQKDTTLLKIVIDEVTNRLLRDQNYETSSVPRKGETVYMQEKIILDLGADLREVTPRVHPDNLKLFRDTAKFFDVRLVGIDFLAEDIGLPWQSQTSAIIELNSLPYIDMHHFPTTGKPINVSKALVEMVLKHYR